MFILPVELVVIVLLALYDAQFNFTILKNYIKYKFFKVFA